MVYQKDAGMDSKVLPSTFWKRDAGDCGHKYILLRDGADDDQFK